MVDFGNGENGTTTMLAMLAKKPAFVHVLGDLSYADLYTTTGVWAGDDKAKGKYMRAWQPAWDQWANSMQPLFTAIPIMTAPGNHELEFQPTTPGASSPTPGGKVFAAYNARFPMPLGGAQLGEPFRREARGRWQ